VAFIQSALSHAGNHLVVYKCLHRDAGNRLADEGFQQLLQTLSSLPHLTVLDVSSNGLTQQSLDSLAALLKSPSTTALQVSLCYFRGRVGGITVRMLDL